MQITSLNYVEEAEKVIKSMLVLNKNSGKQELKLSTSKIRNILSMVSELYNAASHEKNNVLPTELQSRVQYLKMRIAYEAGRDNSVRDFEKKAQLMLQIGKIGDKKENLILFCNYMEALVAYHKFYGGRD